MARTPERHPFAGRKGSAARNKFAARLFIAQHGLCLMCSNPIPARLSGKTDTRDAVVDHLKPWRMCPDLSFSYNNLQLICRGCHATCKSIEAAHPNDPDMIAQAKARVGQDW